LISITNRRNELALGPSLFFDVLSIDGHAHPWMYAALKFAFVPRH